MADIEEILSRPYPIDNALALASAAWDEEVVAREVAAEHEALRVEAVRLRGEAGELRGKLDKPCGECHPCLYWADQTWRAAGRTPPDMPQWDEKIVELAHAEAELEEERRHCAALREERDRLRDELGEKCEELRIIGQTVTRSGRRLRYETGGSDGR